MPAIFRAPWTVAIALAALAASCAAPVPQAELAAESAPAGFPENDYRAAAARGEPVFRIDPSTSIVTIEVHRAGRLAQLGHDHVVASHDVNGFVAPRSGRADLYVPLARLTVDEAALRRAAGFDTVVSDDTIAGTRRNMLGPVLHVERNAFAVIAVRGIADNRVLHVSVTLNGVTRAQDVPVDWVAQGDRLSVQGRMPLLQTEFGLTPLSIAGGAIQVQDEVGVGFALHACRGACPSG